MTPTRYRAGGANEEIRFAVGESSLGAILVASSQKGVASILLGDDPDTLVRDLQDRFPKARLIGGDRDYEALVARVVGFVEAPALGLDLPLDVRGTAFQQRVWQALQEIPVGQTVSYAEIARRIGAPKAVRAIAAACAANNLAVAIPCHRVIRKDGALSGYAWGVERKRALLDREAAQNFVEPTKSAFAPRAPQKDFHTKALSLRSVGVAWAKRRALSELCREPEVKRGGGGKMMQSKDRSERRPREILTLLTIREEEQGHGLSHWKDLACADVFVRWITEARGRQDHVLARHLRHRMHAASPAATSASARY